MSRDSTQSIIIANDLRSGRIVYFTEKSAWSESITDAELLDAQADERLAIAVKDEGRNLVIDPNLVEVKDANAGTKLQLTNIREQIRASGPTILGPDHISTSQAA